MTSHISRASAGLLLAACALLTQAPPSAYADDYPYLVALDADSRALGLGRPDVPLLRRERGPGSRAIATMLVDAFRGSAGGITTGGPYAFVESEADVTLIGQRGWYLQVFADGTAVHYRNYALLDGEPNAGWPADLRLSSADLEQRGRDFIAGELGAFLPLGPGDELNPLFTRYQYFSGFDFDTGVFAADEVVANAVLFTRNVEGVPIVGPGSKIEVVFAADGTPAGFGWDWPLYTRMGDQPVVDLTGIQDRGRMLDVDPFSPLVALEQFACGLVDVGVRVRDPGALVQAGCMVHMVQYSVGDPERYAADPSDGLLESAAVDAIPAGVNVERDLVWPLARVLCLEAGCGSPSLPLPPPQSPFLP